MTAAPRILERCAQLARLSSQPDAICRTYLSDEHRAANALVGGWMREAGLEVRVDAAGSICGRTGSAAGPTLLIGSHLDTVPDAGPYDGILGVLLGIEVAGALGRRASAGRELPFAIEVIGFGEEEGVRFGTTLMSSRACAGTWDDAWWSLTDDAGTRLDDAFRQFGLEPSRIGEAARPRGTLLGYLEAHIEQGPVLESRALPLAVVNGIAGARRLDVTIEGMAAHAGTTPMTLRQDALAAAARAIAGVEDAAVADQVVATVGRIRCEPNAVNVVPARVTFSIDIRAGRDEVRDAVLDGVLGDIEALCKQRGLGLSVTPTHRAAAVRCDARLSDALARGIEALGLPSLRMDSGAGHDAMALADACPVGMLFVRCAGGVSHHPAESVTEDDVAAACQALEQAVLALADAPSAAPIQPETTP